VDLEKLFAFEEDVSWLDLTHSSSILFSSGNKKDDIVLHNNCRHSYCNGFAQSIAKQRLDQHPTTE
jgi:hypothetical protein